MTSKRDRADTVRGVTIAFQNAQRPKLSAPWPLDAEAQAIFDEAQVCRGREEWLAADLRFLAEYAETQAFLRHEERKLPNEGTVIDDGKGPRANPRAIIVNRLSSRVRQIASFLLMHPASEGSEPTIVKGKRKAERTAMSLVASATKKRKDSGVSLLA